MPIRRRRHAKIRLSEIRSLSRLQCSEAEVAGVLGISLKTFRQVLARDERAREAWEEGRQHGKVSLRRKQFRLADTSAPMAIHLGKQYLGQHEVITTEVSGPNGTPIQTVATLDLESLTPAERAALRSIATRSRDHKA